MNRICRSKIVMCTVLLLMSMWLAACSPQYDWRIVSVGDDRVRAMLPAKPQVAERELEFEGNAITLILTSASVDGVLFTLGFAELPDALQKDASGRDRLVRQIQVSLYRNLGVTPPETLPPAGERFAISGHSRGASLRLEGMVWTTSDALIEGMVVGEVHAMQEHEITEFWRELAPGLRPSL